MFWENEEQLKHFLIVKQSLLTSTKGNVYRTVWTNLKRKDKIVYARLDSEESLFCLRFSEESTLARERHEKQETGAPLPCHTFSRTHGHFRSME